MVRVKKSPTEVRDSYVQAAIVDLWLQRDRTPADIQRIGIFRFCLGLDLVFFGLNFIWFFVVGYKDGQLNNCKQSIRYKRSGGTNSS